MIRVAVLWQEVTGYVAACLRALAALPDTSVFVAHGRPAAINPFAIDPAADGIDDHRYDRAPDLALLLRALERFAPDGLLVSSWNVREYRQVLRRFSGRTLRVLAMDNPWLGTARQWLGVAVAPLLVRPLYDAVFLAGERQAVFARKLGFRDRDMLHGVYAADVPAIASGVERARREAGVATPAFLFLGRLVPSKGADLLAVAYAAYREAVSDAWSLRVCGLGPLAAQLAEQPGIVMRGFVQPEAMPAEFAAAACLVQPSRFEPWGVAIHEAAAAGLPVICSAACGASITLVQDRYNGYVIEPGSVSELARALIRFHGLADAARDAMGAASRSLAAQYTPERWARDLRARVADWRAQEGRGRTAISVS